MLYDTTVITLPVVFKSLSTAPIHILPIADMWFGLNLILCSFRKGKFLHHFENYGGTAKDIADWMKK